jgi:hypothetical protein
MYKPAAAVERASGRTAASSYGRESGILDVETSKATV